MSARRPFPTPNACSSAGRSRGSRARCSKTPSAVAAPAANRPSLRAGGPGLSTPAKRKKGEPRRCQCVSVFLRASGVQGGNSRLTGRCGGSSPSTPRASRTTNLVAFDQAERCEPTRPSKLRVSASRARLARDRWPCSPAAFAVREGSGNRGVSPGRGWARVGRAALLDQVRECEIKSERHRFLVPRLSSRPIPGLEPERIPPSGRLGPTDAPGPRTVPAPAAAPRCPFGSFVSSNGGQHRSRLGSAIVDASRTSNPLVADAVDVGTVPARGDEDRSGLFGEGVGKMPLSACRRGPKEASAKGAGRLTVDEWDPTKSRPQTTVNPSPSPPAARATPPPPTETASALR